METITKNASSATRLAELETECKNIIDEYVKQVALNANAPVIKTLQNRLKKLRAEQWELL